MVTQRPAPFVLRPRLWKVALVPALLVLSLTEVIRYGADAPQVVRRLRAMLDELESTLPQERHAAIARQRSLLDAAVSAALPAPFTAVASTADREGLG